VILARENFRSPRELSALITELRRLTPPGAPGALIAADQEGGPVSHLSPAVPWTPSLTTLGAIDDLALTARVAAVLGGHLRALGVTFDLAPVLDVRTNGANMVVFGRVFGRDPQLVARHGRAFIESLTARGVLACAKHFPGHGDTREDSHARLPRLPHGRERLDRVELVPFREVAAVAPAVMLAHIVFDGIAPREPATLSPAHYALLRGPVGFQGVAVTDDLEMAPIRVGVGVAVAAERAVAAGADLVTIAHTPGFARSASLRLASRAARDPAFRARLEEAAGRVRALRTRAAEMPAAPSGESVTALLREVAARTPRPARRYRDPTR
jgi:beta-N-acetylhexosaminidase